MRLLGGLLVAVGIGFVLVGCAGDAASEASADDPATSQTPDLVGTRELRSAEPPAVFPAGGFFLQSFLFAYRDIPSTYPLSAEDMACAREELVETRIVDFAQNLIDRCLDDDGGRFLVASDMSYEFQDDLNERESTCYLAGADERIAARLASDVSARIASAASCGFYGRFRLGGRGTVGSTVVSCIDEAATDVVLTEATERATLQGLVEACGSASDVDRFLSRSTVGLYWSEPILSQDEADEKEAQVRLHAARYPSARPLTRLLIDFQLSNMDPADTALEAAEIACAHQELPGIPQDEFLVAFTDACLGGRRAFTVLFVSALEHEGGSSLDDEARACIDERLPELGTMAEFVERPVYPLEALSPLRLACGLFGRGDHYWGVPLQGATNDCLNSEGRKLSTILDEAAINEVWERCVSPEEQKLIDDAVEAMYDE